MGSVLLLQEQYIFIEEYSDNTDQQKEENKRS